MWLAVLVTTLVIVAVFFSLTLLGGMTGVLFTQLGWIVSIELDIPGGISVSIGGAYEDQMEAFQYLALLLVLRLLYSENESRYQEKPGWLSFHPVPADHK